MSDIHGCACCHAHESHNANHDSHYGGGEKSRIKDKLILIIGAIIFIVGIVLKLAIEPRWWIELGVFLISYLLLGHAIIFRAIKNLFRGRLFDENFLMTVATLGAFILKEYAEGVAVMLFFQIGEFFQGLAVRKSRKSITSLLDIRPDYANLIDESSDVARVVHPNDIKIGDLIMVKTGERIPLDGIVEKGNAALDTSALTGEAAPREAVIGDSVLSGSVNISGMIYVRVSKLFGESTAARIVELAQNSATKKSPTEQFITRFSRLYTPFVVFAAIVLAVLPSLILGAGDWSVWQKWIDRGLIFLVISCPCALVVSVPLGFFAGLGASSKNGILVKGANHLDALTRLDVVMFDKTGTLTKGEFEVKSVEAVEGISRQELLELAAYAEHYSPHPLAITVRNYYQQSGERALDLTSIVDYREVLGQGVSVIYNSKRLLCGNARLMKNENVGGFEDISEGTKLYVAYDGKYAGRIVFSDMIKNDAIDSVARLKELGVGRIAIVSGDNEYAAYEVGRAVEINEVYSGLLPEGKVDTVERLLKEKKQGKILAFVGDGVNDAPVLARADLGVAMGALGSDAAIEAADIVLMTDEVSKIPEAVLIAKRTKTIVRQNIFFALFVKVLFLSLSIFGLMAMWAAVFADVGVTLIAVLNSLRALGKLKNKRTGSIRPNGTS